MREMSIPKRIIMTPGPVEVDPRVLRAMSMPILGQYDPVFRELMGEVSELLKTPFETKNTYTFAIDGSSRSGLEAAMLGVIEEGDRVLIPAFGRFAYLWSELAERVGATSKMIEKEWGETFEPAEVIAAIKEYQPKVLAMVHGETSTGQMQELKEIGRYCQENNVLFIVDAVATFGSTPVKVDEWGIDIAIGGTQKGLSVPAGMSTITYNERVEKILTSRYQKELGLDPKVRNKRFIKSNYLDLSQLQRYWSTEGINHHTEATSMVYAIHEGLRLVKEEGLTDRYNRHKLNEQAMVTGLKAMGLTIFGNPDTKLPTVTCVEVPDGVDEAALRSTLLSNFGVEIAAAFGPLVGKVWRIGNMGYSSRKENVLLTLAALEASLLVNDVSINKSKGVLAAMKVYNEK